MDITKSKKILTSITLVCVIAPTLMLITAIFGAKVFEGFGLQILVTLYTIAVAGAFSINALNIFNKKRIIAIISLCLLLLCTIMAIIIYWSNFATPIVFNHLTIVLAMATVLFSIIVSLHIKLGKKYFALQIITYCIIIAIDLFITINIFFINLFAIDGLTQIFIATCLIAFALLCTTGILGKKSNDTEEIDEKKYVKITKEEYNNLINRIKELETELSDLKK